MAIEIKLRASYGDEIREIMISAPAGTYGWYQVTEGDHYIGTITKTLDGYKAYLNHRYFTIDDEQILLDEFLKLMPPDELY